MASRTISSKPESVSALHRVLKSGPGKPIALRSGACPQLRVCGGSKACFHWQTARSLYSISQQRIACLQLHVCGGSSCKSAEHAGNCARDCNLMPTSHFIRFPSDPDHAILTYTCCCVLRGPLSPAVNTTTTVGRARSHN